MSLFKEKIDRMEIRKLFPKVRAGDHKYRKRCMVKYLRQQSKDVSEDSLTPKKMYKGWEY